jgi:hypothetical protein
MGKTFDTGYLRNIIAYDASGNVGIGGAPSGSFKFEVTGTGRFTGALTANARIQAQGSNGAGSSQGGFLINYNTNSTSSRSWLINNDLNVFGDFAISQSTTQTGLTFDPKFYINPSGNLGLGTSSPDRLLHLNGAGDTYIRVDSYNGTLQTLFGTDNLGTYIGQQTNNIVRFITNATERMRITSGGNVQIGTSGTNQITAVIGTNPQLQVNGNISSNTVGDCGSIRIGDGGSNRYWIMQLDGSYQFATFYFNGSSWTKLGYQSTGGTWTNSDERRKENIEHVKEWYRNLWKKDPKRFLRVSFNFKF